MYIIEVFKGREKHDVGSEETPEQYKKNGDKEKIDVVISFFHNCSICAFADKRKKRRNQLEK